MQEMNAQLALKLHQATGEPLAHCSYLLGQTNGDYETAYRILDRILQQRKTESAAAAGDAEAQASVQAEVQAVEAVDGAPSLEERVARLERQLAQLGGSLDAMSRQLTQLLDKLT